MSASIHHEHAMSDREERPSMYDLQMGMLCLQTRYQIWALCVESADTLSEALAAAREVGEWIEGGE